MSHETAFINRSLTTIHNELEFLKDSGVISDELYEQLTAKLPKKYSAGAPSITKFGSSNEKQEYSAPASAPPVSSPADSLPSYSQSGSNEEIAEALYDYPGRDPTDLPLEAGRQLVVLERLNPDWWKGRDIQSGREGIFPSNYVKVVQGDHKRVAVPPVSYGTSSSSPAPYGVTSGSPAPYGVVSNSLANSNPYYPPPSTNYYQNSGPSQPTQPVMMEQPQQQQQHSHGNEAFKRFGSKLGNAAIFGAGATLGSDLVNSIL